MTGNGRKKKKMIILLAGEGRPSSRKKRKSKYHVYWENPPGPSSGIHIHWYNRDIRYQRKVEPRDLLNPSEVAAVLDFSRMHVYRLMESGELKAVKRKGRPMVPLKSVMEFLRKRGLLPEAHSGPFLVG